MDLTLAPRSMFGNSDSNFTCAKPIPNQHGEKLSIGITFRTLMCIITAVCLAVTTLSALFLSWKHLHRYTAPREQRQQIRIIFMPVFFSVIALLSIVWYEGSVYLEPLNGIYEAICLASLFLLYVEYVCPDQRSLVKFFDNLESKDKKGNVLPGGSLRWFNRTWIIVFQFPVTMPVLSMFEIITEAAGVYCSNSLSPHYAHIWILVLSSFNVAISVIHVLRFYLRLKAEIPAGHFAFAKLLTFKGLVFCQFVQAIVFGIVHKYVKPSATVTYDDFNYGLPMMLVAIESLIFSFAYHFAFRSREYHPNNRPSNPRLSVLRAVLDAMNPTDIIRAIATAFSLLFGADSTKAYGSGPAPRRQRTQELDNMSLEPLRSQQSGVYYDDGTSRLQQHQYPPPTYQHIDLQPLPQGHTQHSGYDDANPHGSHPLSRETSPYRPPRLPRDTV